MPSSPAQSQAESPAVAQRKRLTMPEPYQGLVRVTKPDQTQNAYQYYLAEDRVTITEEREQAADDGGFDEIQKVHTTFHSIYSSNYSTDLKAKQPCGEALYST
jgi:hypothetical protein